MATSYGALCDDFYVNQKLTLRMDMPSDRETVLHLFEQIRRAMPDMKRFRRYEGELALESSRKDGKYRWIALRRTSLRTGIVNPDTMEEVSKFHRMMLEIAPFHLTISPLDVDFLELLFGFDFECKGNHDQVVANALLTGSPLADLVDSTGGKALDIQPAMGLNLTEEGDRQAYFEVKTRHRSRRGSARRHREEPISCFQTIRQYGPVDSLKHMQTIFDQTLQQAEELASSRLNPYILQPISRHITSDT